MWGDPGNSNDAVTQAGAHWSHAHMMLGGEMSGDRRSIDHIPVQTPRPWVDILSNAGRKECTKYKHNLKI